MPTNKKVEELVERDVVPDWEEFAKIALDDPDLAWIVKRELPELPDSPIYSNKPYTFAEEQSFRMGALTYRKRVKEANCLPVIPLAEALREVTDD